MDGTHQAIVREEVEALQALYGDEQISFRPRQSASAPASISISLETLVAKQPHPAGAKLSLSAFLPDEYPTNARPRTPTLRADEISAATCTRLVQRMLENEASVEGEVCLFEYCEAIISILNEYAVLKDQDEKDGKSASQSAMQHGEDEVSTGGSTLFHSEPLLDRKSVFQAHVAVIRDVDDVDHVLRQLKRESRKVATATHNTLAYRVVGKTGSVVQDADDDGEKGAGKCVLYVLQQLGVVNVLCIVSRWFGGIKLGPARFKHISKVARDLVEDHLEKFDSDAVERAPRL